jgi:hypothetical protein
MAILAAFALLHAKHDEAIVRQKCRNSLGSQRVFSVLVATFVAGEPRVSDKLFIDLWGLTISADGVYAIGAAVIIVLILVRLRLR